MKSTISKIESGGEQKSPPVIWVVALGFNNADDTIECLHSVRDCQGVDCRLVFVDNNSRDDSVKRVLEEVPSAHVLQTGDNIGFARGYNAGIDYCLKQGAEYVLIVNNDTVLDTWCIKRLWDAAEQDPEAGMTVPKIYYHTDPQTVWSAGSRFRVFPPALIMRKTRGPDDGRFDHDLQLAFTTTCALLLRRSFLVDVGLIDRDYFILYDDYDWCIRAREKGYGIRLVPDAHLWHKVSKSTGVGSRNPFVWTQYGRSTAIFFRKHRTYRWLTHPLHITFLVLRMVLEGTAYGVRPFWAGWRKGRVATLHNAPHPQGEDIDSYEVVRS